MSKFQADSLVHSKIPKRKKQGDSRINQLIEFAKATGVHIDNMKSLYAEGGGFKGLFKKIVGSREFQAGLGEMAAYGAGIVVEGASGGTLGFLTGLGVEAASFFGRITGNPVIHNFKPGEWVAVDNGEIVIKKAVQRGMDWTQGAMFGGEFPTRADQEIETERLTSIGFVVSDGATPGTTKIFNMETGQNEDKNRFQIVALKKERQVMLDANLNLRTIKQIVLNPNPPIPKKLRCDVPCDPGEEVVYQKQSYRVVTCDGTHVRITNGRIHFDVNMSELTRGRVKHTNAWNYGAPVDSGFDSDSRSKLHAGQWVWLAPRFAVVDAQPHSKKELGCVRLINGVIVDGYYALDGVRFQTHESQIHPVLQERQAFLDQMKGFRQFKHYTVVGSGLVRNYAPGPNNVLLCTGQASLNKELLKPGTNRSFQDSNFSATPSMPLGPALKNRSERRAPGKLTEKEVENKVAARMAKQFGIPRATAEQMVRQGETVTSSFAGTLANANSTGVMIGIAAAALFVIFYATR